MIRQTLNIRMADPTIRDGLFFSHYMNEASDGFFRFMMGKKADQIIARAFVKPGHDLSYEHVFFAERRGIIAGMFSGYTAEQHCAASREVLYQAAGAERMKMRIVDFFFAPVFRILDSMTDGDFYLQGIAVDRKKRRSGIGSILMDAVEDKARTVGAQRLSLDVAANNAKAIRFYRQRGMTIESKWPKRLSIPGFSFYRMVKPV